MNKLTLNNCMSELENVSGELMNVAVAVCAEPMTAEKYVLDTLLVALESGWVFEEESGEAIVGHFKDQVCRHLWQALKRDQMHSQQKTAMNEAIRNLDYFTLTTVERLALVLKSRMQMSYAEIAFVLEEDESFARELVAQARESLLHEELLETPEIF